MALSNFTVSMYRSFAGIKKAFTQLLAQCATLTGTETLTNKTLTSPILNNPTINGATVEANSFISPVLTTPQINDTSSDHQYVFAASELAADRTVTLPVLTAGDTFVFADCSQTLTNKTLTSPVLTTPQINDTTADHQYVFAVSELAADRTVTLPLLTGNDVFVFADFTQTLTNKTLTSPVIGTGLTASGSAANDFSGSTGTFITSTGANTLSGAVTVADAATPSITLAAGKTNSGFLQANGKTSGGIKFIAADASAYLITVTNAAQTVGATTLTIPNMANASDTFAFIGLAQTLTNKTLTSPVLTTPQINDTSADHQYVFAVSELAADRTVTLPLLTGNDTFVFADHIQTLTNKTLTSPVITTPQFNDTTTDHQYILGVSELSADRTITLPLLTGNDVFVFADFTQTLTNKTLTAAVISGGLTAAGSASNDFSASTGTFKTSTGVNTFGGLAIFANTTTPVAAAGSTVTDAGQLPASNVCHITSDSTAKGVKLPAVTAGGVVMYVVNDSSTAAELYAESTGTVNGLSADASVVVPASKGLLCISTAAKTWIAFDMAALATAS